MHQILGVGAAVHPAVDVGAEAPFRRAFEALPVGMAIAAIDGGRHGRLHWVNGPMCALLGYDEPALRALSFTELTHPDDRRNDNERLRDLIELGMPAVSYEQRYVHADGRIRWLAVSTGVLRDAHGRPEFTVNQLHDVTEQRANAEHLAILAMTDPLTRLANRALFTDRLTQAVHRSRRSGLMIGVLYCDLDAFKAVNDEHGHSVGDEVLVQASLRIAEAVRPSDTVARLGGDEFAVICEDLPDARTVLAVRERVRRALLAPMTTTAGTLMVGASIGVACAFEDGSAAEDLVERADLNMFADKRARAATEQG